MKHSMECYLHCLVGQSLPLLLEGLVAGLVVGRAVEVLGEVEVVLLLMLLLVGAVLVLDGWVMMLVVLISILQCHPVLVQIRDVVFLLLLHHNHGNHKKTLSLRQLLHCY